MKAISTITFLKVGDDVIDLQQDTAYDRKNLSRLFLSFVFSGILANAFLSVAGFIFTSTLSYVPDFINVILNDSYTILVSILFVYFSRKVPSRRPCSESEMTFNKYLLFIISFFPLMFFGSLVGVWVSDAVGVIAGKEIKNVVEEFSHSYPMHQVFISSVIIAPITEEILFRKIIIDKVSRHGIFFSTLFSGVLFGAYHGNFHQFFYATFLGILLAVIYYRYGKLRYTIILHSLINFIGTLPMIFENFDMTRNLFFMYISACYTLMYIVSIPLGIIIIVKSLNSYIKKNPLLVSNGCAKLFDKNIGFILFIIYTLLMFVLRIVL